MDAVSLLSNFNCEASGESLRCTRDSRNLINPDAVKLHVDDGDEIGFVPDHLAADVSELLEQGGGLDVRVVRVNPPPAPRHHRVLCSLFTGEGARPNGYRGRAFRPISSEATDIKDRVATPMPPAVASG
jgi:hypothetical protein